MKLIIIFLLLPFSVFAQQKLTSIATLQRVQGAWNCIYSVYDDPMLAPDEPAPYALATPGVMLFENDTLSEFNFPCELVSQYNVKLENGFLLPAAGSPDIDTTYSGPPRLNTDLAEKIFFRNDTLILHADRPDGYYTEKHYIRTVLDSNAVSALKKFSFNPNCLTGTWKLQTTYDSGYDGNGMVTVKFPFAPQHTILFSATGRKDFSNGILWLKADGISRPFQIVSLSADGSELEVQTMDWYKGESPFVLGYTKQ